jgi:fumarate hydratase, class I
MPDFVYTPMFPLGPDTTEYEPISRDHVTAGECGGRPILEVAPEGLSLLAERAFHDAAFYLRVSHLEQLAAILEDPESSANDRTVALELLKNAVISADGVLPMCQDTGTAIINAKKGQGS